MSKGIYIFASSEDSGFSFNTPDDFQIQLANYVDLNSNWVCCVKELQIDFFSNDTFLHDILIMSDICTRCILA